MDWFIESPLPLTERIFFGAFVGVVMLIWGLVMIAHPEQE